MQRQAKGLFAVGRFIRGRFRPYTRRQTPFCWLRTCLERRLHRERRTDARWSDLNSKNRGTLPRRSASWLCNHGLDIFPLVCRDIVILVGACVFPLFFARFTVQRSRLTHIYAYIRIYIHIYAYIYIYIHIYVRVSHAASRTTAPGPDQSSR